MKNGAVVECGTGVRVAGTGGHTILNVVASGNAANGFLIESSNNRIEESVADYNTHNGFLVFALGALTGNSRVENVAFLNNADGFNVGGTKNQLSSNLGISVGEAGGTSILSNISLGNPLDMEDLAPACADHTWSGNIFSSSEMSCIQ